MLKNDYIEAVSALLDEGKDFDGVIKNLKEVLEKKGHQKLYKSILIGLQIKTESSLETNVAQVSVARQKDLEISKERISKSLTELESDNYDASVDPSLIGGYVIEYDNKIIDNSYKSRLVTLYRSLIE